MSTASSAICRSASPPTETANESTISNITSRTRVFKQDCAYNATTRAATPRTRRPLAAHDANQTRLRYFEHVLQGHGDEADTTPHHTTPHHTVHASAGNALHFPGLSLPKSGTNLSGHLGSTLPSFVVTNQGPDTTPRGADVTPRHFPTQESVVGNPIAG